MFLPQNQILTTHYNDHEKSIEDNTYLLPSVVEKPLCDLKNQGIFQSTVLENFIAHKSFLVKAAYITAIQYFKTL